MLIDSDNILSFITGLTQEDYFQQNNSDLGFDEKQQINARIITAERIKIFILQQKQAALDLRSNSFLVSKDITEEEVEDFNRNWNESFQRIPLSSPILHTIKICRLEPNTLVTFEEHGQQ